MTYFGPPPPPKKSHTTRTILIVVGIVLVLCCGGAVAGGFALYKSVSKAVGPVQDTAGTFLGALETGNTATAYAELCSSAREQFTPTQFEQVLAGRPKIVSHKFLNTNVMDNNGVVTATVNAELRYADGSSETHLFRLTKESSEWRVCGNPY